MRSGLIAAIVVTVLVAPASLLLSGAWLLATVVDAARGDLRTADGPLDQIVGIAISALLLLPAAACACWLVLAVRRGRRASA